MMVKMIILQPVSKWLVVVLYVFAMLMVTMKGRIYRADNLQPKGGRAGQPHGVLASGGGVAHHLCG